MNYIGWDLHQQFSQIVKGSKDGTKTDTVKLYHFPGMFDHPKIKELIKPPIDVAVEACNGWYWVVDELEKRGAIVHLAHPLKTKLIAEAKVKTDKIDAKALYDLLRTGFLPESYIPSGDIRQMREIHRHRAALVKIRTSIKNRIHSVLAKNGIFFHISDLFGKKGRTQLDNVLSRLPSIYSEEINRYLTLMDTLNKEIEIIEKKIRSLVKDNPLATLLETIPAIGYFSAHLILSEIGDIHRFAHPKKLVSYVGLNPGVDKSGKHHYNLPITKQGNTWLRWLLIQIAPIAARKDRRLGVLYDRISKRKGANTAKVAVAREILVAVFWVLKKQESYCPKSVTPGITLIS